MNEPGIEWCKQHVNCLAIRSFKNHWPEFVEYLQKTYPGLKFSEQLYRYYYHDPIPCPICGKLPKYQNFTSGYSTYCSIKCAVNAESTKSKFKQTCQERYGSDSPLQSKEIQTKIKKTAIARHGGMGLASASIKEKIKKTCIERYGADNPAKSDEVKEKAKRTCLERYGTEYVGQSDSVKEKIERTKLERYGDKYYNNSEKAKRTCQERYGVENPSQSEEIQEKIVQILIDRYGGCGCASPIIAETYKQTCQERYGTSNTLDVPDIREKIHKSCINSCGTETPFESPEIQDKIKQTNIEKYDVEYPMQSKEIREKSRETCMDRYGVPYGLLNTVPGYSKASQEYFRSLDEQYPNAMYATKGGEYRVGPYLLDWYDPDSNTVIEFNGDYWHANPKLYSEDWIHPIKKCTAKELWEHDRIKKEYLESLGYNVKIVWESEINIS